MYLSKKNIENTERIRRLNIINAVSGIKPANLIGTISKDNITNVAIFSSVIHLGSDPALIGFILRPQDKIKGDTFTNILENGYYTINHVHESFMEQAHYTSAKFKREESEFIACHFTEEYLFDCKAPFVKQSKLKLGMKFIEQIPIKINNTSLIIGQIEHLILPDEAVDENGYIDVSKINDVGISGLNNYYSLKKKGSFPYAKANNLPF